MRIMGGRLCPNRFFMKTYLKNESILSFSGILEKRGKRQKIEIKYSPPTWDPRASKRHCDLVIINRYLIIITNNRIKYCNVPPPFSHTQPKLPCFLLWLSVRATKFKSILKSQHEILHIIVVLYEVSILYQKPYPFYFLLIFPTCPLVCNCNRTLKIQTFKWSLEGINCWASLHFSGVFRPLVIITLLLNSSSNKHGLMWLLSLIFTVFEIVLKRRYEQKKWGTKDTGSHRPPQLKRVLRLYCVIV